MDIWTSGLLPILLAGLAGSTISASNPAPYQQSIATAPLIQPATPTIKNDLTIAATWACRYPMHIVAAGCAGILTYHLLKQKNTDQDNQNSITPTARGISIGLCLLIGLAALVGQDNTLRGVDYLAGLKFVMDVIPKLQF